MAQLGAPISNVTFVNWTGGFGNIDEASASDADFNYSIDRPATSDIAEHLFTALSDPLSGTGTTVLRYRVAEIDGGVLGDGTKSMVANVGLYQGTTLIQQDANVSFTGAWTTNTMDFSANIGSITNFADLRIRITYVSGGTGSPANRRGMGLSWAQLELPDVVAPTGINIKVNIADVWKDGASMKINIGDVWKDVVAVKQNIGDVWKDVF